MEYINSTSYDYIMSKYHDQEKPSTPCGVMNNATMPSLPPRPVWIRRN